MWRVFGFLFLLPNLSFAEGNQVVLPSISYASELSKGPYDYFCRGSNGERYEMGDIICVSASCTTWMAKCDMSLNNPMWRKIQDGCVGASLEPSILDRIQRASPMISTAPDYPKA